MISRPPEKTNAREDPPMTNAASSRYWLRSLVAASAALPMLLGSAVLTEGNAANSPALRLLSIIPIPVTPGNPNGGMYTFDISWVDPNNGLYYLADRSNRALDVIDTTGAFTGGKADSFFGQIGGSGVGFTGFTGSNPASGPDGVVSFSGAGFNCVFVGDVGRVNAFNFSSGFPANPATVMTTVTTSLGGVASTTRVDEMAVDTKDSVLFVVNPDEAQPFGTLYTINKTNCTLSAPIAVSFASLPGQTCPSAAPGCATNGAEQPLWDPKSGKFYQPIPEVNGPGGGGPNGGLLQINPLTGAKEAFYQINFCNPQGAAAGPNGDLLVACGAVFDLAGNVCVTATPSPAGQNSTIRKALCTAVAY